MKVTKKQKYRVCKYIVEKYAPVAEDGVVHRVWEACDKCPFNTKKGCGTIKKIPEEFKEIANGPGFEYIEEDN